MLMIRFQRIGRRNDPAFRIVVIEKTASPKAGTYVDLVGTYNPRTKAFTLAEERVKDWIKKGAQVSPSLKNLLITKGILDGKKVNVLPKKRPIQKEAAEEAVAPAAPTSEVGAAIESVGAEEAPSEATPETVEEAATEASTEVKEEAPAA